MDLEVSPRTVQSQVVEVLRNAILTGRFAPGERIVESKLCELTKVSRTSIREALRRLEGEKLIVFLPNRGPQVAKIDWPEAQDIYRVRALLEGEAAALFAARATKREIQRLKRALSDFARSVEANDTIGRVDATTRFYDVILAGSGNRIIYELLKGLLARVNVLRSHSMSQPGRSRHSLQELRNIFDAVQRHDPKAARQAAIDHVIAASVAAEKIFSALESELP